jgi:NifB/MoaA-like Fe-S oxidoreductase
MLGEMIDRFNDRSGAGLVVAPVVNDYFGGDVSVAGLLTGGDFLAAREQVRGDFVIIPRVTLKSDEPIFLDGLRFEELERQFDVPVHALDFDQLASFLQTNLAACRQ